MLTKTAWIDGLSQYIVRVRRPKACQKVIKLTKGGGFGTISQHKNDLCKPKLKFQKKKMTKKERKLRFSHFFIWKNQEKGKSAD